MGPAQKRAPGRLSYANVASTLALILVVSGGIAWALERNSVKSKHIVNDAVRGVDVREQSLGTVPDAAALGGVPAARFASHINLTWDTTEAPTVEVPLGRFGALFMTGSCAFQAPGDPEMRIRLRRAGGSEPGFAQVSYVETGGEASDSTSVTVTDTATTLLVETDDEIEAAGLLVYSDERQVTTIPFRSFVDADSQLAECTVAGQATTSLG